MTCISQAAQLYCLTAAAVQVSYISGWAVLPSFSLPARGCYGQEPSTSSSSSSRGCRLRWVDCALLFELYWKVCFLRFPYLQNGNSPIFFYLFSIQKPVTSLKVPNFKKIQGAKKQKQKQKTNNLPLLKTKIDPPYCRPPGSGGTTTPSQGSSGTKTTTLCLF